jgi:plastocyanin
LLSIERNQTMKKLLLIAILSITTMVLFSAQHTITNSGFTFSPSEITIQPGDTIVFSLGNAHNAVEVSKATWDANESTSNGGFSLPFGGGNVSFSNVGTYYYVCVPHVSEHGMKGIIHVATLSGISTKTMNVNAEVFPNPASKILNVNYNLKSPSEVKISLLGLTGEEVSVLSEGFQNSGEHNLSTDQILDLQPGLFLLKIEAGEAVLVKKIIIE